MGLAVRSVVLSILAGVAYFLGFAGFGYWPLIFVFPAFFLWSIQGHTPIRAMGLGGLTGFVAMCGGYYWAIGMLQEFARLPLALAVLGYALLNLYQGALWGVVAGVVAGVSHRARIHPAWLLPLAVMTMEGFFPLLFPSVLCASFASIPILNQIADLGGVYLVDGFIVLVGAALYSVLPLANISPSDAWRLRILSLGVLAFNLIYGGARMSEYRTRTHEARKLSVALIQANLGAGEKTVRRREFLRRHQVMSKSVILAQPNIELVVWPEAAFNRAILRKDKDVRFITRGIKRPILSGAISIDRIDGERFVYNSAILTSSTGFVRGTFDKVQLLAFGETIPFVESFPQLKKYFPQSSTFDRGTIFKHLELEDGTKLLPMICYEDLIPSFVRRMWRSDGPAHVLVNITNDSWYGNSHEPYIHLALATLRSIETRRALIRSTNTGISAFVTPSGVIRKRAGQWTQEVLVDEVPIIEDNKSTIYMLLGDWSVWGSLIFLLILYFKDRLSLHRTAETT